jgi:hypothetical protein
MARRPWLQDSIVFAVVFSEIVQNFKHARTAFDGLVEMKDQMGGIFQHDMPREFSLERGAMRFQFVYHAGASFGAKSADENVRALEIGRDINSINADQRALEVYFSRDDST